MAQTNAKFRDGTFGGYNSSNEILQAIEDVAGVEFDLDEGAECWATAIWADPTPDQLAQVEALAWSYADPDETTLHWGDTKLTRTVKSTAGR